MAIELLNKIVCEICDRCFTRKCDLSRHLIATHKTTPILYTIEYLLAGELPKCECGCGGNVKVFPYRVNEVIVGHSGGGNWQSVYAPGSEEYVNITNKLSKSVSAYMKDNPRVVSDDTRKKQSKYWTLLYRDYPEEKYRRQREMTKTKRKQSKDGTLSRNHFVHKYEKDIVQTIYSRIGEKSSRTKLKLFSTGQLIQWNTGLTRFNDHRVRNYSGQNHYRWNSEKELVYPSTFYNPGYRQYLLNRQNGVCLICDTSVDLVLHHVDGDKQNSHETNLIFVERSVHTKLHSNVNYREKVDKIFNNFLIHKGLKLNGNP